MPNAQRNSARARPNKPNARRNSTNGRHDKTNERRNCAIASRHCVNGRPRSAITSAMIPIARLLRSIASSIRRPASANSTTEYGHIPDGRPRSANRSSRNTNRLARSADRTARSASGYRRMTNAPRHSAITITISRLASPDLSNEWPRKADDDPTVPQATRSRGLRITTGRNFETKTNVGRLRSPLPVRRGRVREGVCRGRR